MTLRFFALTVLVVSALAGPVAAQDATNTTETNGTATGTIVPTAEATSSTTTEATSSATTVAPTRTPNGSAVENVSVDLGPTAEITRWRFEGGTWFVTVRADIPLQVTMTDAAAMHRALSEESGARASRIPYRGFTADSGTTTLEMAGETRDGQGAVSVAANGRLVVLRTGSITTERPPVPWSVVQLLVGAAVVGTAGGTWWHVSRKYEKEDKEAERIL